MSVEFKIPELGENIEQGDVVKVCVGVGDAVAVDQTVFELETDKAVVEVPSSVAGVVKQIHLEQGQKAKVGQVALTLEASAAEAVSETADESPSVADTSPTASDPEVETQAPVPSPPALVLEDKPDPSAVASPAGRPKKHAYASPSVRRFAREIGIDIEQVSGSGKNGRIVMDDVKAFSRKINSESRHAAVGAVTPEIELPDFTKWGDVERKPMSSVRRKTALHLSQAWYIPHVTQFDKTDVTDLESLRKRFGKRAEQAGGKLTMTAIILKIVASALKVFPQFNASVDMASEEIVFKKYVHIGVAVDTDRGLLVPVIRDVDKKNILQLSVELSKIGELARNRKLGLDDMQGGTFTISNLGGLGGTAFTPIVNSPEVAILGVSRGSKEPVYIDGAFEPRLMLPLSLSYDHRIIDGADAVRFLRWICEALQQPFLMDLEG